MGFHDFLENQRRPAASSVVEFNDEAERDNYEERIPQRRETSSRFDSEDQKALDEVEFYKERLYKKIDSCFIRYGLAGLKKIDEGIAKSLADYIDSLNGRSSRFEERTRTVRMPVESYRRSRSYEDEELEDEVDVETRQSVRPRTVKESTGSPEFKKPQKIEGSDPNPLPKRRGESELQADVYNPELLNAILTDVIPPTEIHPVEIHSNIQVHPTTESSYASDSIPDEVQESVQTSHYDIAADMLAGVENEEVDLIVPPTIEEPSGEVNESVDELPTETVEFVDDAPTDKQVESKKRKKKK